MKKVVIAKKSVIPEITLDNLLVPYDKRFYGVIIGASIICLITRINTNEYRVVPIKTDDYCGYPSYITLKDMIKHCIHRDCSVFEFDSFEEFAAWSKQ